jgi:LPS export ABC transporter protein LptC
MIARAVVMLAAGFAVAACSEGRGAAVKPGAMTSADSADQIFYGVQAPFEVNGVKRGTLFADTLYVLNDGTRYDFTVGHVDFNTETGAPNGSMKADRGRYDQRTQILQGWGHVVVKMVDGRELKSPHVVFNQGKNEISSDTTFEAVLAGGRRNTGTGFHSDPSFAHYTCLRDCHVYGAVNIPK